MRLRERALKLGLIRSLGERWGEERICLEERVVRLGLVESLPVWSRSFEGVRSSGLRIFCTEGCQKSKFIDDFGCPMSR